MRISKQTESRIIQLWLAGLPRDTIAQQVGVSPSTVSEIVLRFPPEMVDYRKLAIELTKHGSSVFEALKGAKLLGKLAELNVEPDEVQNLIQTTEKMCKDAGYEPKEVIRAAMKLSKLEEETGESYFEAIMDFDIKKGQIQEQDQKALQLQEKIRKLEAAKDQALERNRLTEEKIACVTGLGEKLLHYGIALGDVENLIKYIQNMQETGGNASTCLEFIKEQGSLKGRIVLLQQKERQQTLDLQSLCEKQESVKTSIDASLTRKSDLDKQNEEEQKKLDKLRIEVAGAQGHLQTLQQHAQELENRNQAKEREILDKLKIDDHTTLLVTAIASLQDQMLSLSKETSKKRERLALADTIAEFLTRMPTYDFNHLFYLVQSIKQIREKGTCQPNLQLSTTGEQTRILALKVFEGDLASKTEYKALSDEKEEYKKANLALETKASELEVALKETGKNLDDAKNRIKFLEAIKVNVEGQNRTLGEIEKWLLLTYSKEIDKKVSEKLEALAISTYKIANYAYRKLTRQDNKHREGEQL